MKISKHARGHRFRWVAILLPLSLIAAACGDDGGDTGSPPATVPEGGGGSSEFEELVEEARNSDHIVRMALDSYTAEEIDQREQHFEERFGFPLRLENEPGHASQDIPQKVVQAASSGRGVVDLIQGGTSNNIQVFEAGALRKPNWDVLETEWPLLGDLRERAPGIENDAGETMAEYCTVHSQMPWVPFYATDRVDVSEFEDFVWEDLTDPKWNGRLVLDGNAAGLFVFPFAEGWDEEALADWTRRLGENNPTIVTGGSSGVMQAVLQGEGDVGIAISRVVDSNRGQGAPVDYIIPHDFIPVDLRTSCMTDPGVNDPSMVQLFWAWSNAELLYLEAEAGGDPRLWAEEAEHFPIAERIAEVGLDEDDFAYARTVEEYELISGHRATAIEGFTP